VERINVNIDETNVLNTIEERKNLKEQETKEEVIELEQQQQEEKQPETEQEENDQQELQIPSRTPNHRVQKNHPPEQIIGDKNVGIETRGRKQVCTQEQRHLALLSIVEPNKFEEANNDEHWIKAM
jgi:FtsZ-interacting cell division protein YlmF